MNGSADGYSAEQLMSLLEQMQTETEEKDRTIQKLERQCERKDRENSFGRCRKIPPTPSNEVRSFFLLCVYFTLCA